MAEYFNQKGDKNALIITLSIFTPENIQTTMSTNQWSVITCRVPGVVVAGIALRYPGMKMSDVSRGRWRDHQRMEGGRARQLTRVHRMQTKG